jgi:hypothetical protein
MTLAGGSRPPVRGKGEAGRGRPARGEWAGACWAARSKGKGKEKGPSKPGRAGKEEMKEGVPWAGPQGEKRKRKRRNRGGPAQ